VQRVVVEQQQSVRCHTAAELERVADRRVAPAEVLGVLRVGVLAVVDEQLGVMREVEARDPVVLEL